MASEKLLVGFGEVDIMPSEPVLLAGYYYDRKSTSIHDRLFARSMAISDGKHRVVLCVADLIRLPNETVAATRRLVQEDCGLAPEALILSTIHSHTAPDVDRENAYTASLPGMLMESVRLALADISPSELKAACGTERTLQFIRRYRMKDGSVRTNPGILNPDVVEPIGKADPEVRVLLGSDTSRTRGGLVHFALHCDTVGGTEVSADWTCYLRRRMQEKLGNELVLLTPIGPAGDVNHWNVFNDVSLRGFAETDRIGTRLAHAAAEALDSAEPVQPGRVCGLRKEIEVKIRMPSTEELTEAKHILSQPPPDGVDFTMERVEAMRRTSAAKLGPSVKLDITALTFGNVALVGIPAEYFTELGRDIKSRSPFDHTLVVTLANGNIGYVGTRRNYEEGGYEVTSSVAASGTGEMMADAAVELLNRGITSD